MSVGVFRVRSTSTACSIGPIDDAEKLRIDVLEEFSEKAVPVASNLHLAIKLV